MEERPANATDFLSALYGSARGYLEIRLVPEGNRAETIQRFFRLPDEISEAADYAAAHNGQAHVFFSVLPRVQPRGDSSAVTTVPLLFADIDAKDFPGGEAEVEERFEGLATVGFAPTILVRSGGGGRHAYWVLREPIPVGPGASANADQVKATLWALAAAVGVPPKANVVHDLARILRVPDTLNIKAKYGTPQLCSVESVDLSRRYDLADFGPLARSYQRPQESLPPRQFVALSKDIRLPEDPELLLKDLDLRPDIQTLIRDGAPAGQRSESDQKVIVALLRAGADPDRIQSIFRHPALSIGAKYREPQRGGTYLGYSISRAKQWLEAHPLPGKHEEKPIKVNHLHVLRGREDNLLAICDLQLSGDFVIEGARILQGERGPFVALPSRQGNDGKYKEVVHPVTKDAREALNAAVLKEYEHAKTLARESCVGR